MSPPPSPWKFVGRNGYGEAVEENLQGNRRVATPQGWQAESALSPWRACRARSPEDARLAMASLADPWVSQGFDHNLRRAYITYRLPAGQPFGAQPAQWASDSDASWKAFEAGVVRHRGQRVLRAWLHRRPLAPDVPRWEHAIVAPGGTASRGLQWGLAHRLEEWARSQPSLTFKELGLVEAGDASTGRIPAPRRQAWSANEAPAWAPVSVSAKGWPVPPGRSAAFGKKTMASWPSHAVPVFWATPSSIAAHGDPSGWWAALAEQPQGVVVVPDPAGESGSALAHALRAAGRTPSRWRVGGAQVWSWGWLASPVDQHFTLEQWAKPVDPGVGPAPIQDSDERVPYRPLSQLGESEGMAGLALEANMHAALRDFSRAHSALSVDEWVAEGLGLEGDDRLEHLADRLSPEQVDAIALARQSLEDGLGFLLSDETGFGKGRSLAAMALTGLRQGRTVVFITENPYLFSDFYRDLAAVSPDKLPVPTLLHQSARVVDPQGRRVATSLKARDFKNMLATREWGPGQDQIIFTTYAQLSRKHDGSKMGWLKDRMGSNGWLLLDEAHNAAGESAVGERMEELVKASAGTVFASATFAKHEANLNLYKPVLALPAPAQRLLKLALAGDDGRLREALTQQMARAGRLVRREHPPVPPPKPVWVEMTDERRQSVEAFSQAWRCIFDAAHAFTQLRAVRESVWLALGAALSRSVREFSLQLKTDALVELIDRKIGEDKKVVVVVDTTMEAALRAALTPSEDDDEGFREGEDQWEDDGAVEGAKAAPPQMVRQGDGPPPMWRDRLLAILESVCPTSAWEGVAHSAADAARQAHNQCKLALEKLPDWDLAPLDRVRRQMDERLIPCGELSGRQTRLILNPSGWEVINRNDPDRNEVVRAFNAGELDVMFVTRAGCAGISLHAGRTFEDQRVRCLVEWDIAANPVNRVQFWGRVRRKDQVVEPEFEGLVLDTPEDRRIVEREDAKRRKLTAHMGTSPVDDIGWISPLGEALVEEWAAERPRAAFRIGVGRPLPDMPLGRVDRALVRSLVLPGEERLALLSRLARGVELGAPFHALSRQDRIHRSSRALQRAWWWGDPSASSANPAEALSSLRLDLVERVWRPDPLPDVSVVTHAVRQAHESSLSSKQVLTQWRQAWSQEAKSGVPATPARRRLAQWSVSRLVGLDPGKGLTFTHPALGRPVRGVMLEWSVPDAPPATPASASAWALSQVAVRVWAVGDAQPMWVSLAVLARDGGFKVSDSPASTSWFSDPPVPHRCLSMEGHPVQAAAWGRRWGWGRSALVRDEDEGGQVVWLLPSTIDWARAQALPRDLVDVDHALAFWRQFPDAELAGALPAGQRLLGAPVTGGLRVAIDVATLESAKSTWMHHSLQRRLRLMPVMGEPHWQANIVPWKYVPALLHGFASAGVGWRAPAKYLEWYRKTSPERTRSRSG